MFEFEFSEIVTECVSDWVVKLKHFEGGSVNHLLASLVERLTLILLHLANVNQNSDEIKTLEV